MNHSVVDSSYIFVCSNQSKDYFPHNTANSFKNFLDFPIQNGSNFEVGIVRATFSIDKDKNQPKFFGHSKDDNLILLDVEDVDKVKKDYEPKAKIENFVTDLNSTFKKRGIEIKINTFREKVQETPHFILHNDYDDGTEVNFTKSYALAFGFPPDMNFPKGKYKAKNPYSQSIYESIDASEKLIVKLVKYDMHDLLVDEPKQLEATYLISEINKQISPLGTTVVYDGHNFIIKTSSVNNEIKFSKLICDTFGLEEKFYRGRQTLHSYEDVVLWTGPTMAIIKSNIVSSSFAFEKNVPYLEIFKLKERPAEIDTRFNPIVYMPASKFDELKFVSISLEDENGNLLDMKKNSVSSVLLKIREKI